MLQGGRLTGRPCGVVVKLGVLHFAGLGLWVQIPGVDLHTTHQAMLWWHPTYKNQRKMGTDVSLATIFLKQKEEG